MGYQAALTLRLLAIGLSRFSASAQPYDDSRRRARFRKHAREDHSRIGTGCVKQLEFAMKRAYAFGMLGLCGVLGLSLGPQPALADTAAAVVSKYDKDSDRTLDLAELKAAAGARFDRLNKDADATLDMKEVKGVIGERAFAAADTDHDGTLSKQEYIALLQKLFEQADTDHDGTLNAKELRASAGRKLKRLID